MDRLDTAKEFIETAKLCLIEADYRSDLIIAEALARDSYAEAVKIVTLIKGMVK